MIATNVSRHAQRLPLTAPSGPDYGVVSVVKAATLLDLLETYCENGDCADRSCKDDEHRAAEQQHQCQLAPDCDVHAPQELHRVSKRCHSTISVVSEDQSYR